MLDHLSETNAARVLMAGVEDTLAAGIRTADLGGTAGTGEFTAAVVRAIDGSPRG